MLFSSLLAAQVDYKVHMRTAAEMFAAQRQTVGAWCRQDFEGQRLDSASWVNFKPLTMLKDNPEFSQFIIVARYDIPNREKFSWDVDVTYWEIGRYERGIGYVASPGTRTLSFTTKEVEGNLFITEVDSPTPRVSKRAAVEWMKKQLENEKTSELEKAHLRDAIKALDTTAGIRKPAESGK